MRNLNAYLKKHKGGTLMTVFPHPDDETFAAGGLLRLAAEHDWHTAVYCLTRGEAGQNFLSGKPANLDAHRAAELEEAADMLGVDTLRLLNFPDGRLRETVHEWRHRVERAIAEVEPDVVVSYGHSGITGHPDHIVTSVEVLRLLQEMEARERPELFWPVPNRFFKAHFRKTGTADLIPEPNYRLDPDLGTKWQQIKAFWRHRSQFGKKRKLMISLAHLMFREELYYKVDFCRRYPYRFVPYKI